MNIVESLIIEDAGGDWYLVYSGIEINKEIDYSRKVGLQVEINKEIFIIPTIGSIVKKDFPFLSSHFFYEVYNTTFLKRAIIENKKIISLILEKIKLNDANKTYRSSAGLGKYQ